MNDGHGGAEHVSQHESFDETSLNDAALDRTITGDEGKQPLNDCNHFLPWPSCSAAFSIAVKVFVGSRQDCLFPFSLADISPNC